mmetsp:Transcript_14755/g.21763  ORF Transcript_14755/g.21763 Transcript_14755/m.21763 type:complete len:84 (+) Transcript_14755:148-399(+)
MNLQINAGEIRKMERRPFCLREVLTAVGHHSKNIAMEAVGDPVKILNVERKEAVKYYSSSFEELFQDIRVLGGVTIKVVVSTI